jgi:hypothetical protein
MLSRARALWRSARTLPVLRRIVVATDRLWWDKTIRRADVVDLRFVAAAMGRSISARRAIREYTRGGFQRGMSLNPLFAEGMVSRQLSDSGRVPALYAYLVNDRREVDVSPQWDAVAYARHVPESLGDAAGPLGHAWRSASRTGTILLGSGDRQRRTSWPEFHGLAILAAAQAREGQGVYEHGSSWDPSAVRETTIIAALDDDEDAVEPLGLVAGAAAALGASVSIGVGRPSVDTWVQLALSTLWIPGSTVRRLGAAADDVLGELVPRVLIGTVVCRAPRAGITLGDFLTVAEHGKTRPTAPLWLAPDGTVVSAGIGVKDRARTHILSGHPAEDARALGTHLDVVEITGPVRAWRVGSTAAHQTILTATVIGPPAPPPPGVVDIADTDLDALLAPLALHVSAWQHDGPVLARAASEVALDDGEIVPSLRWAIKTAAPAGRAGEAWGDTHFARGLARALRRLGQEVVIDAAPACGRPSTYLDDVSLVLRGPRRIRPSTRGRTILWVISHPDEITQDEVADFDTVFAASVPWADRAAARYNRPVRPLLQCTDSSLFHPTGSARTSEIVFVGTARGIARPSVVEPIAAGVPVSVYGPDWRGFIPASRIAATGIPNAALPALYERASVVLNDHWPAMQREGFISNRPYDVVAAGGRVISDDVEGIAGAFGGAVVVYRSISELLELLTGDLDRAFPPESEIARISERIRARDTFDARARTLLAAVIAGGDLR